jgi:hypothetical protein
VIDATIATKKADDAHVETRGRLSATTRLEDAADLVGDQSEKRDDEDEVDDDGRHHDFVARRNRCQAHQDHERADGTDQRSDDDNETRIGENTAAFALLERPRWRSAVTLAIDWKSADRHVRQMVGCSPAATRPPLP